jgi:lipid II isoglutaminyl synthase (glutamine-hydrolysing)
MYFGNLLGNVGNKKSVDRQENIMKKNSLTIGWLYPELMSTYGDRGNIIVLQKRCNWRKIGTEILRLDLDFKREDLRKCDFLFMGGAQDREQQIVAKDLMKKREDLKKMIEDGVPGLFVCGAYQFLGNYYREANGTVINSLKILDLFTENPGIGFSRLIGNVAIRLLNGQTVVGFENHGGRTYLEKNIKSFGKVIKGFGNNGKDQTEGAIYKNTFGTYLHGPILPKNPEFADYLIKLALEKKYNSPVTLSPLDDAVELQAHRSIIKEIL